MSILANLCSTSFDLTPSISEAYYTAIKDDPELHVKLTGSWESVVGEQDVFCVYSLIRV